MFGTIPLKERRVAPPADDINIGPSGPLQDRRFCVYRGRDIDSVLLHRQTETRTFPRSGQQATALILVMLQTFLLEKTLFLGKINSYPVTNMIVDVGDKNTWSKVLIVISSSRRLCGVAQTEVIYLARQKFARRSTRVLN